MPSFFSRKSSRSASKDMLDSDFESVYSYDIKEDTRHATQKNSSSTTRSARSAASSSAQLAPETIAKYQKSESTKNPSSCLGIMARANIFL